MTKETTEEPLAWPESLDAIPGAITLANTMALVAAIDRCLAMTVSMIIADYRRPEDKTLDGYPAVKRCVEARPVSVRNHFIRTYLAALITR